MYLVLIGMTHPVGQTILGFRVEIIYGCWAAIELWRIPPVPLSPRHRRHAQSRAIRFVLLWRCQHFGVGRTGGAWGAFQGVEDLHVSNSDLVIISSSLSYSSLRRSSFFIKLGWMVQLDLHRILRLFFMLFERCYVENRKWDLRWDPQFNGPMAPRICLNSCVKVAIQCPNRKENMHSCNLGPVAL